MKLAAQVQPNTLRRVTQAIRSQPERAYGVLKPTFERWGTRWEHQVQDRIAGATTGPRNLVGRSGQLKRSLKHRVSGSSLGTLSLQCISAGAIHARIHEYGGEIRPKNGKYLTIPLPGNRTPAGVARVSARSLIASHETFFLRAEAAGADRLLLMWKDPSKAAIKSSGVKGKGNAVPMFVLVPKVELPGPKAPNKTGPSRLGFFDEWKAFDGDRRRDIVQAARLMGRA